MDALYANYSISITEFKKNPAHILREAGDQPVAVLSHNRPAFYMVPPQLFASMMEVIADQALVELAKTRLAQKAQAIEVDIDAL